ncbi:MAG TPA: glycosyltransferase family 9 protein [Candidatus Limnocylindrales bacterium]|nr:glycosyltransferase family 9 protein [Candidatus Limnocylindrales bacterium]
MSDRVGTPAALPPEIHEIAILRALVLGDLLCAVPMFRSIRRRFPDARITLIGLPWARSFVERFNGYLDDFVEFPGFPGIKERNVEPARIVDAISELQRRDFGLAIQAHGSGLTSNAFTALIGARTTVGFVLPGAAQLPPPAPGIWVEYPGHGPEVHRLLRLAAALGGEVDDTPEFPLTEEDETALRRSLPSRLTPARYAVVHPGASHPPRRWPIEQFAAAADHLAASGLDVVVTGNKDERDVAGAVVANMRHPALDLSGRTSLGALGVLIRDAALMLANDTGVSHIAAGLRTPSVIVFSEADPIRWAPLDTTRHIALGGIPGQQECPHPDGGPHRCMADACRLRPRDPRPAEALFPGLDDVMAALDDLLRRWPQGALDPPRGRNRPTATRMRAMT